MGKIDTLFYELDVRDAKARKGFRNTQKEAKDTADAIDDGPTESLKEVGEESERTARKTRSAFGGLRTFVVAVFAGVATRVATELFKIGSAIEETRSRFITVFGDSAEAVQEFIDDFGRLAGVTRNEGRQILGTLGAVSQGLGFAGRASADFAQEVFRLSADLASFNNLETEDVAQRITSALTGERESLKQLGVVITEVAVQQQALADTGKTSAAALTQQEKATATLTLVSERAGVAVGDLERTQNSTANTSRRIVRSFRELRDTVATGLLPVFADFATELDLTTDQLDELTGKVRGLTAVTIAIGRAVVNVFSLTAATVDGLLQGIAFVVTATLNLVVDSVNLFVQQLNRIPGIDLPLFARFDANLFARGFAQASQDIVQDFKDIGAAAGTIADAFQGKFSEAAQGAAADLGDVSTAAGETARNIGDAQKALDRFVQSRDKASRRRNVSGQQGDFLELFAERDLTQRIQRAQAALDNLRRSNLDTATEYAEFTRIIIEQGVVVSDLAAEYRKWREEQQNLLTGQKGLSVKTLELVDDITKGVRAAIDFGRALGFVGDSAAAQLNTLANLGTSVVDLIDAIGKGTALGGPIAGVVSGLGALVSGLFVGESAADRQRRQTLEKNTAALEELERNILLLADVFQTTSSETLSGLRQLAGVEFTARNGELFPSAGIPAGVTFQQFLQDIGVELFDLQAIAQEFGLSIDNIVALLEGRLSDVDVEGFAQEWDVLRQVLDNIDLETFTEALDNFRNQISILRQEFEIFDITDPIDQLRLFREQLLRFTDLPEELRVALATADLSTAAGRTQLEQAIQDAFRRVPELLLAGQLGGLTADQFRAFLVDLERLIDAANAAAEAAAGGEPTSPTAPDAPVSTRTAVAVAREQERQTSEEFETLGTATIEELARSQASLDTMVFLLSDIDAVLRAAFGAGVPFGGLTPPPLIASSGLGFSGTAGGGGDFVLNGDIVLQTAPGTDTFDARATSQLLGEEVIRRWRAEGRTGPPTATP